MAKRTKSGQAKHDKEVRKLVNRLRRTGWVVQADLPNFDKPDPIGKENRIPDIRAKKGGAERIFEVETPDTVKKDSEQHSTFRRRAGQKKRTTFEVVETE